MRLLVIGSGGREHALVWKLAQSPHAQRIWCAPGNAGLATERLRNGEPVESIALGAEDLVRLRAFALERKIDLTVVGPDNPLALGMVDYFQEAGLRIWGPNRRAATFESSKAFAQSFMERHGIPTARAGAFQDPAEARRFAEALEGRCAVKADGLALGKGVILCQTVPEAWAAIDQLLVQGALGSAGSKIVIQEYLEGIEISLHALCDGETIRFFPTSQDHKRALDDDRGPNTGGMGTCSPAPFVSEAELAQVARAVLQPWLAGCAAEGIDFRGLIYPGVMLTAQGPRVLEFNARFGDPETQVYLMRLRSDLVELLSACCDRSLARHELEWRDDAAVCVVMASGGYPGAYDKGIPIDGLEQAALMSHVKVFHAGTARQGERIVTNGGRVLGVTALGPDLQAARDQAYAAVDTIHFAGAQHRRDIALKALRTAPRHGDRA